MQSYLPAALTDAELAALVAEVVREIGAAGMKDMGKVMAALKARVAGKAEGGRVSAVVKQALGA